MKVLALFVKQHLSNFAVILQYKIMTLCKKTIENHCGSTLFIVGCQAYHNEEGVGAAIAKSGIPRNELFIVSKI